MTFRLVAAPSHRPKFLFYVDVCARRRIRCQSCWGMLANLRELYGCNRSFVFLVRSQQHKMAALAQVMEVTGCDEKVAKRLLEISLNNVEDAMNYFFEHGAPESVPDKPDDEPAKVTPPPVISFAGASPPPEGPVTGKVDLFTERGPLTAVKVTMAWMPEVHQYDVGIDSTVKEFKRAIADKTSVPTVVQRLLYNGQHLADTATLKVLGMAPGSTYNVACLYQPRDEHGDVYFKKEDGTPVYTLKEGEWNVRTSVTEVRKAVAAKFGKPVGDVALVFNALTLLDATSFGQNGLSSGSVVTVLDKKTLKNAAS